VSESSSQTRSGLDQGIEESLEALEAKGLRRSLRTFDAAESGRLRHDGRNLLDFSSNDYLGLANDERLREAAIRAIRDHGLGAAASRLVTGTRSPHVQLEEALAHFKKTEAALSFSTGYATATGTIPALVGREDVVILDKWSHACLIDGARLSGATLRVFPHNQLDRLREILRRAREKQAQARILVVTESVFSMDGDTAPLRGIADLKDEFGAILFVDEAHAVGVLGEAGRGLINDADLIDRVEIQMGTLGKALGSSGGYIAGSSRLIDYLVNHARSFIFSTAPTIPAVAAARESLQLLQSEEGAARLAALRERIRLFDDALARKDHQPSRKDPTAIRPHIVGEADAAVEEANRLLAAGFLAPAIRFPTVPRGTARLRVTLSAIQRLEDVQRLAALLSERRSARD